MELDEFLTKQGIRHDALGSRSSPIADFLAHYGVKGMRWGVRKWSIDSPAVTGTERRAARAAVRDMKQTVMPRLNKSQKYTRSNLRNDPKLRKAYEQEAQDSFNTLYRKYTANPKTKAWSAFDTVSEVGYWGTLFLEHDALGERTPFGKFRLITNELGHIESIEEESMEQSDSNPLDTFLAHFGIKGMRWGFRRQRGSDGTVSGGVKEGTAGKGAASGASVKGDDDEDMAVDALRVVRTSQKAPHQMSDREIKEANARADAIKRYNELYGPKDPNRELSEKVARLELEKKYSQLKAELYPSFSSKVGRLIRGSAPLFSSVAKSLASKPTKKVLGSLAKEFGPAFSAAKSAQPTGSNASKASGGPRPATFNVNPNFKTRGGPDSVFNVSNVGRPGTTYGDPSVSALNRGRR